MPNQVTKNIRLLDVNPLEHITRDIAISQRNYESVLNGLVQWNDSKEDYITIRLATRTEPYIVDYTIHTKYYYDTHYGSMMSSVLLAQNNFAFDNRLQMTAAKEDNVTLRLNVNNAGNTKWQMYQVATVYDELKYVEYIDNGVVVPDTYKLERNSEFTHDYVEGMYFRTFDATMRSFQLYQVVSNIIEGDTLPSMIPDSMAVPVCSISNNARVPVTLTQMCVCTAPGYDNVYIKQVNHNGTAGELLSKVNSGYMSYCEIYGADPARRGELVYYMGDFFVSLDDNPSIPPVVFSTTTNSEVVCQFKPEKWSRALLLPFTTATISGSGTIRVQLKTDVDGFVLRNVGGQESGDKTMISANGNITFVGEESSAPTGVNILPTSNYVNWPEYNTSKWIAGAKYTTRPSLSAFSKQDYSAVMVFNHFDSDIFKYKNIVNYNGPDLDQGLCVMLPVTVTDENNYEHEPEDGSIIEFLFNIWPDHSYDGRAANDLIINKSQIYVYSVPNYSQYKTEGFNSHTVEPIAKFSMARLVNFYVFSENVGVPDRPVCYKARFIYSKEEGRWKTYDYYQLPDHIFISPSGFVDPTDPKALGVESAGFPLYQNPFCDYDLSAIHVDDNFFNQIQDPGDANRLDGDDEPTVELQ